MRNHTTIPRQTLIQHVAQCIPEGHNVSLANPEIFILVEVFKVGQDYFLIPLNLFICRVSVASPSSKITTAFKNSTSLRLQARKIWRSQMKAEYFRQLTARLVQKKLVL